MTRLVSGVFPYGSLESGFKRLMSSVERHGIYIAPSDLEHLKLFDDVYCVTGSSKHVLCDWAGEACNCWVIYTACHGCVRMSFYIEVA